MPKKVPIIKFNAMIQADAIITKLLKVNEVKTIIVGEIIIKFLHRHLLHLYYNSRRKNCLALDFTTSLS